MQEEPSQPQSKPAAVRSDRILVVDDDLSILNRLVAMLKQGGYIVSAATDASRRCFTCAAVLVAVWSSRT